jgi:competence ComEA-like helix-hairpin-helix protein
MFSVRVPNDASSTISNDALDVDGSAVDATTASSNSAEKSSLHAGRVNQESTLRADESLPVAEEVPVDEEVPFSHFGSRFEKYLLIALVLGIVVVGGYRIYEFYKPLGEIVVRDHPGPGFIININTDHAAFLSQLEGIDGTLGLQITEWREKHGPFKTVDEMTQVEGIDQQIVDANREWICVD